MTKIKSGDVIALKKEEQKKISKENKLLKKKIKRGEITIAQAYQEKRKKIAEKRGLIYIGHLPHGFYENELKSYFQQFGRVTNVQVCRSGRTGNSKGYAFVEFSHPEVAQIAGETMNNYLMFKKRIVASFVPSEKRPVGLFSKSNPTPNRYSTKIHRERQTLNKTKPIDEKVHLKKTKTRLGKMTKRLEKLKKCGINYTYEPVNKPQEINK